MSKKSKKKSTKKKSSKKTASKKTPAKKAGKKKKGGKKKSSGPKPMSKSDFIAGLMERHELSRKQVVAILDDVSGTAVSQLIGRGAPGKFTLPGLARFILKKKPARPARKGKNPFTGEETTFKARPATQVVKIYPIKALKEAVAGAK